MAEIDDSLELLCDISPDSKSVASLCSDIDAGLYEPAHHQRPCRWPSRLFELLILTIARNLPLAPIHLCEHPRGPARRGGHRTLEINDGGHRLRGIYAYRNNEFPICLSNGEHVYYSMTPATPGSRRAFTPNEQLQILEKHGYQCVACHARAGEVQLEFDHVDPLWKGGEHHVKNAQVLCPQCHAKKTAEEAADRARQNVGTSNDRVMTEQERSRFDNYPIHIVTYKNYRRPAAEVHRIIFRQVQNGVTMDANDKIFAQASNPFVKFIETRLEDRCKTLIDLCRIIKTARSSPQDFWDITKSNDNIYKVMEALFRGMIGSHGKGDTYVPGPCSLKSSKEPQCHINVTRDDHLRPFEVLLSRANAVCDKAAPGRAVRYEDFAIVFHACHSDPTFHDRVADAAVQQRCVWLPSILERWSDCRSLQTADVQTKITQLQAALTGSDGTTRVTKRRR